MGTKRPAIKTKPTTPKPSKAKGKEKQELRLLLQTRSELTPPQVAAELRASLERQARVEPLYGKVGGKVKSTEFLARIALADSEDSSTRTAFDIAHTVRDSANGAFTWAEPDVLQAPKVGFPDELSEAPDVPFAERAEVGDIVSKFCMEKVTPPTDKYWHLRRINVQQAWDFSAASGSPSRGVGVRIGHLDTGWSRHPDLFPSLDLEDQFDFVDNDENAEDPQEKGNKFHGSRTGTVIASAFSGDLPDASAPFNGDLCGVAPEAKLVPVRVVKSVVVFFNGDVARGIKHAADKGCHVISMSFGGIGGRTLRDAVRHAVAKNVIVCAAAGNCVEFVVEPAAFPESIAVAATNSSGRPWKGSSHGPAVDITAPGAQVWTAARPTTTDLRPVSQGEGTSFAVAAIAGIAALWLAHHGRDALINKFKPSNVPLQFVFRHVLAKTARELPGLPKKGFGAGFVNAEAVLKFTLPRPEDVPIDGTSAIEAADPLGAVFADLPGPVSPLLRAVTTASFRTGESAAERDLLAQEFAQICFDHPNARDAYRRGLMLAASGALADGGETERLFDASGIAKYASMRLRSRLVTR